VDRELLLEIGCEELPAGWLPELTNQVGEIVLRELRTSRLPAESSAATYSTPRRLAVHIARVPERQTDLEEVLNGPPVSASFGPDGTPTRAAEGFAAKHGVTVQALERVQTAKGEYIAFRKRQRGRAAIDVLPEVLGGTLRGLSFPKAMHWDATLEDGRGDLLFGRPIRWMLFLYGGRVVPFTITRNSAAQTGQVQDVPTGAVTYGHRFLTTSGRAGRAIKVRSFDEYRARLLENFVIVERSERHNKIARELDAKAQRLHGRISRMAHGDSGLLHDVPDLVEYPSVIAGTFSPEFLSLPEEVLTTTLIHHQHYFPIEGDDGKLRNAFLAVINTEPDNERTIARNAERVVTARLRDATFFWEADRKTPFPSRVDRLATLLFHKKLGTYQDKAQRVEKLAEWIARESLSLDAATAAQAATAARLAKADLTTDMVREFTELQGTIGGIYAREEGQPEEVWKAIYYHYLPVGVEPDAPPTKAQLGKAAATWAAVSLADKLDTIVGLFSAGEKPTGSRDPYGLRRAAQGVVKILVDLPDLGVAHAERVGRLIDQASAGFERCSDESKAHAASFVLERFSYLCEARGFSSGEVRAIRRVFEDAPETLRPLDAMRRVEALRAMAGSENFLALAELFKRVKNITKGIPISSERFDWAPLVDYSNTESREGAEKALIARLAPNEIIIQNQTIQGDYKSALTKLASFRPEVSKFFDEVMVMADDERVRSIRLSIMARLRDRIISIADISEMFGEAAQSG
jgi:glycyl-tRNA synthetase beta chain